MSPGEVLFRVEDLRAGYGGLMVLDHVSVEVTKGTVVALVGPNGAGKTTFADTCAGVIKVRGGRIVLGDRDITGMSANDRVAAGLSYAPSGARCFGRLSVFDNLRIATLGGSRGAQGDLIDRVFLRFPRLAERRKQQAGTLSGGERQLLAVARALIQAPKFLILDEPSLGLSPLALRDVLESVVRVVEEGELSVLLVEQNVAMAFDSASKAYVLNKGTIVQEIEEPGAGMAIDVVGSVFFGAVP